MFENIKIGQKLWSFELGDCKLVKIKDEQLIMDGGFKRCIYDKNGCLINTWGNNIHQTLFWSKPIFKIPEEPINYEEMFKKLKIKEFKSGEHNYYLSWNYINNCLCIKSNKEMQSLSEVYFEIKELEILTDNLYSKNVDKTQLFEAFNKVFR